jgi:hypothetical protein
VSGRNKSEYLMLRRARLSGSCQLMVSRQGNSTVISAQRAEERKVCVLHTVLHRLILYEGALLSIFLYIIIP